jgi:SAM-dependent methyltransferase
VDTRNALEWLRGLVAAEHASHHEGRYAINDMTAMVFSDAFPVDARAILNFTISAPSVHNEVVEAIRSGNGVPSPVLGSLSAAAGGVNGPTYAAALVPEWIAGVPGLTEQLEEGGAAADLAAGNGDAAALVANAFPRATVVGYDIAVNARNDLPPNVEMRLADARDLPGGGSFDLVYCLDSFHHLGDAAAVLAQVSKVLTPGGVLMVVESDLTGDMDIDAANRFGVVVYACGLLYCLQENLAAGGIGHSNGDGPGWVIDAMTGAGFGDVKVTHSETGYNVITGRTSVT